MSNQKNIQAVFSQILKAISPLSLPNKNIELHQLEAIKLITMVSFCFFGAATPEDLVIDSKQTPFNINNGIELRQLTFKDEKI